MNRFFSAIFLLFLLCIPVQAVLTSGRLIYLNGTTATLYYDTDTASYKDTSATNPNVYVELCANDSADLLGKFTAIYYRSGNLNLSISPLPVNITSLNASNCSIVDVDISMFKGYYPGIVSIGVADTPQMTNPIFIDLTNDSGLLSGRYEYTSTRNTTNTVIHIEKIYYSGTNEITSDKPYLLVALYNNGVLQNNMLVNRTTDAVFPATDFDEVRINNLSAYVYTLPITGGENRGEKKGLELSLITTGYVGDEVEFTVIDSDGDKVRMAEVTVYKDVGGSRMEVGGCRTDSDGVCTLLITEPGSYVAVATKTNYEDSKEEGFNLRLHTMSISVEESYYIRTQVEALVSDADTGAAVKNVKLELYSPLGERLASCYTSDKGMCTFEPKNVGSPGTYSLLGTKQYYQNGGASFEVSLYPLEVDYPNSVYTRQKFNMRVYSLGKPLSKVVISFKDGASYTTDENGRVDNIVFNKPGAYLFTVEKADYRTYEDEIIVSYPPMFPVWPNETYTKETFIMAVKSPDPLCTGRVAISIGGYEFMTADDGTAEIYIPVENNYTVTLVKEGCAPYEGLKEILERPPEARYEPPIIVSTTSPTTTIAQSIAESLGIGSVVKSGCSGIYIEGMPTVFCDLVWFVVIMSTIGNLLVNDNNLKRLVLGFGPIIIGLATIPSAGAVAGALAFAFSYKSWLDARAMEAAMKEKAEEVGMEILSGKPPKQPRQPKKGDENKGEGTTLEQGEKSPTGPSSTNQKSGESDSSPKLGSEPKK